MVAYNEGVTTANKAIGILKETAASTKLETAVQTLKEFRNQRARYQPTAVDAIAKLVEAKQAKKSLENEKKEAKEALDKATNALFKSYQAAINKHLKNCGCGYAIVGTKTVYAGGKPRTEYQLVINNTAVELGVRKAGDGPCFKNTLSDGDKSTLAFAFFLARLELDPMLADKIVILDDPMTSLDAHRRTYTRQQIVSLAGKCRQMIVLTHDSLFARQVWDELPKPKKALQIADSGDRSTIMEWDVIAATQSDYFTRYRTISDFVESGKGEASVVAISLRLLLEGNLRMRFPAEFPAGEWLGDFIKRVKNAAAGDNLHPMKTVLTELTQLNDYAKQFHHDQNPAAASIKPVDAELKAFGRRTLEFAAGKP
jgi:wobble nucleotide-excising tRNase